MLKITKSKEKLSVPVEECDADVNHKTASKMMKFFGRNGKDWLGLASNQVGLGGRVIVIRYKGSFRAIINPVLTDKSESMNLSVESCLSVPNKQVVVERHFAVTLSSYNFIDMYLTGQDSFVVQHEIDHLDGILMIDKKVKNNLSADEMIRLNDNYLKDTSK